VTLSPTLLLLDNYDSFTWNLAQYLEQLGATVEVVLNDRIDVASVCSAGYAGIVISPGPGRPEGAGITLELIRQVRGRMPLLGVCLGHQAIGQVHGADVVRAPTLMHGKTSWIHHDGRGLFDGLPEPFAATRYHSLTLDPASIPSELTVTARTAEGVIMAIEHRHDPLWGVQFHPESILTLSGKRLLSNYLERVKRHGDLGEATAVRSESC